MKIDCLCPRLNPARFDALYHATARARRDKEPMFVFVGPPGCGKMLHRQDALIGPNVWFVRSAAEGVPAGAELFQTVQPFISNL